MTREEARKELSVEYLGDSERMIEAKKIAVKALEQEQYYKDLAESYEKTITKLTKAIAEQEPTLSIDDVMSVFDDFMCGEVDEEGTETFLEMLKDKAESEKEESKSEWQKDHEILKAYSDGANEVLDKIRAEIKAKIEQEEFARSVFRHEEKDAVKAEQCTGSIMAYNDMIKLIDKYKAESDIEKLKPCINYEDGCEEWAGCPCVYYKGESRENE